MTNKTLLSVLDALTSFIVDIKECILKQDESDKRISNLEDRLNKIEMDIKESNKDYG